MLIGIQAGYSNFMSTFRFQNMWLLNDIFLNVVKENWEAPLHPDNNVIGMTRLWLKLKRLKYKINWWNRTIFKNLFANILVAEDFVNSCEIKCQVDPLVDNFKILQEAKESLFLLQDQEEIFWRQKVVCKHLLEGDKNTKHFHSLVKTNRAKRCNHKIIDAEGNHIERDGILPIPSLIILLKVWKRLCDVKCQVEPHLFWGLDKWLEQHSVDQLLNTYSKAVIKVSSFISNNCWDYIKLAEFLPDVIIQKILKIPWNVEAEDILLCDMTKNGNFSIMNAWHTNRVKHIANNAFSMIWHKNIPTSVSIFIWRLFVHLRKETSAGLRGTEREGYDHTIPRDKMAEEPMGRPVRSHIRSAIKGIGSHLHTSMDDNMCNLSTVAGFPHPIHQLEWEYSRLRILHYPLKWDQHTGKNLGIPTQKERKGLSWLNQHARSTSTSGGTRVFYGTFPSSLLVVHLQGSLSSNLLDVLPCWEF
ncbi:hypothetical protein M5K25_019101 [Dendrobium thyrsiflorum]|uniref:Reverse transcriptase zinc-binding domain-containing protein n=1 Tax=Dendrobium thyrsiflorum TaxID=117978 RepID=A0ABD0UKV3_DENTH